MQLLRVSMLGCALTIAAGCARAELSRGWAGSVVDSAGVRVVTSPNLGLWQLGESWTVREDLRIGSFGTDPRYQFGQVGSISLTAGGGILVMDRQTRELREFTERGEFVRVIGAAGQGPGEFSRRVSDVLVSAGDTLLIPDVGNRRVHRFAPDGAFLDAARLDIAAYRPLRFRWNPVTGIGVAQIRPTPDGRGTTVMDELRRLEPDGTLGPTLLTFPAGDLLGPGGVLRYFTPEPMWTVTDSFTVLYGVNDVYRIGLYDRAGAVRMIIAKEHDPQPITDRDIRAFFAYLDRAWLAAGVPRSQLQENHRRVSFATVFPAFSTVHAGRDGSIWVQPVRAPSALSDEEIERYNFIEDFGGSDWDVFDRDGRFLGVVAMPARFQPRLFVGDAIYGVLRDEFDVQYVVRVRVVVGEADGESA